MCTEHEFYRAAAINLCTSKCQTFSAKNAKRHRHGASATSKAGASGGGSLQHLQAQYEIYAAQDSCREYAF